MTEADLQKACRTGDQLKIREILGSNPNLVNLLDTSLGWPPLYRTVTCGHFEATKDLLALGADPNIKNKLGDSPLHQAVESNQLNLVQLLLDSGADVNIQQHDGDTPLHYSCLKGLHQISSLLLKYQASPNIQDQVFGKTPLHIAVESKNTAIIQALLKNSARVDIEDFSGRTPVEVCEDKNLLVVEHEGDDMSKKTPSFDFSELSVKYESLLEPECEHINTVQTETYNTFSFGSDPHKNSLYKWLTSMKLESLFSVLFSNGYDDLEFLLAQVRSSEPITLSTLEEIGIRKAGHRMKLLALLEEEAFKDFRSSLPVSSCLVCSSNKMTVPPSLEAWLESIGLAKLLDNFVQSGFDDMETLVTVMHSKYPLSDESLKTILGIQKLGHRQRILQKLREDTGVIRHKRVISRVLMEKDEPITACDFCNVF